MPMIAGNSGWWLTRVFNRRVVLALGGFVLGSVLVQL